jgi:Mor family transcriptional regulator
VHTEKEEAVAEVLRQLPGDLRRVAEVLGLEAAVKLSKAFRGTYLYVHGLSNLRRLVRDEEIRRAYDQGVKVKALALRYGLTERHIRRILSGASVGLPEGLLRMLKD